jgi:hypothetical protein
MFTILVILAVAYVVLKVLNTNARFASKDAEREAEERAAMEAEIEEEMEVRGIRFEAVDVEDVETIPDDAVVIDEIDTAETVTADTVEVEA